MKKLVLKVSRGKHKTSLIIIVLMLVVAGYFILRSHAAQPSAAINVASTTPTSPAKIVSDTTAAGGSALQFTAAATPPSGDFHTCYPNAFCDSNNNPVTLNGFNVRFVGQSTSYTTLAQMQRIKAQGFNAVRFAMRWNLYQPSAGTGGFDSTSFNNLKTAVANAKAAGIYVILDPIHFAGDGTNCGISGCIPNWATGTASTDRIQNNAKAYIQKVAGDYAGEPDVVAIDLANEVRPANYDDDVAVITMYNSEITNARAVAPNKSLIIESTTGDKLFSANTVAGLTTKTNIIYSFHDYYGGVHNASGGMISGCGANGYTSSGAVCGLDTYDSSGGYLFPSYTDLNAHVAANLSMLADARLKLPLYIGEYSIAIGLTNAAKWRADMVQVFNNNNNISRTYWEFYNQGPDPATEDLSATDDSNGSPGAWRSWIGQLL